jgi:serine/threonine protein kinase
LPEDFRSDIYSLGGTLFHAMAGRPPYEAENGSLVALKQLKSRSVSLQTFAPDISNETAYVINRMMSKKPEDRYQSYDDLIDHLSFALGKAKETQLTPSKKASAQLRNLDVESKEMRWVALLFPIAVGLGLLVFALLYFFTNIFKAPYS